MEGSEGFIHRKCVVSTVSESGLACFEQVFARFVLCFKRRVINAEARRKNFVGTGVQVIDIFGL